jgi:selenocysteine-specific elongation factor
MHVIGTAGHVDHGKSSLVQRLTGIDPDRWAEEKRRGLTIDLGFAWLTLPSGEEIGIVDVPGHERFIRNMLAGAGGVSVCLFVVAANEGWQPQSAEHLGILNVLGVAHGVVALTKSDTVDDAALEKRKEEVAGKLRGTTLEGAPIVPCSATTGDGIDELLGALDVAVSGAPPAEDRGRPRLWVDRVFTIAGAGTVVTGTLGGGALSDGDDVALVHAGSERRARVRRIQSHKKELERALPGNRVALNLAGMEREGAERGDAVVAPGAWRATSLVSAWVNVLPAEVSGRPHKLVEKGAHLLYVGSAETPVRIKLLRDAEIPAGGDGPVQLHLRDPLPLARGDRFVLRDAGRVLTFGGGVILDPLAPRAKRGDEVTLAVLDKLRTAAAPDALAAIVTSQGWVDRSEALLRAGATGEDVIEAAGVRSLGDLLVTDSMLHSFEDSVRKVLAKHHELSPLRRGADREALRSSMAVLGAPAFSALIDGMDDVIQEGPLLALKSHAVQLSPAEQAERDRILALHEDGGFSPPFAKELGAPAELLRALTDAGELVKIGDFYLGWKWAESARYQVRSAIEEQGPLTVAQIRDLLGTSRKYAVPLCEWLDSTGATKRQGDVRALGPKA